MVRLVLLPVPDLGPCSRPALSPCFVHGYGLVLVPGSSPALHMVLVLVLVPNLVGPGSSLFQVLVCYWLWPPSGGSDLVGPGSGCSRFWSGPGSGLLVSTEKFLLKGFFWFFFLE